MHVERELIGERIAIYQVIDGSTTTYFFSRTTQAYYLENGVKEFDQTTNYLMQKPRLSLIEGTVSFAFDASFPGLKDEAANKKLITKFLKSSFKREDQYLSIPYSYPDNEDFFYLGLPGETKVDREVGHYGVFTRNAFVDFRRKLRAFDKNFLVEVISEQ